MDGYAQKFYMIISETKVQGKAWGLAPHASWKGGLTGVGLDSGNEKGEDKKI